MTSSGVQRVKIATGVLVALVLLVLVVVLAVRTTAADQAASRAANKFNRVADTVAPSTDTRPIVTLVGDDYSSAAQLGSPVKEWPYIAAPALHIRLISLSTAGAGYTSRSSNTSFGGTFVARAQQVDPESRVVVFFGGGNDLRASTADLALAVERAIAAARSAAPRAALVVVGPPWAGSNPPASILDVRNTIRDAAERAKVTWIDPIQRNWLGGSGVVRSDGSTLTAEGESVIADRMEAVLRSAVQ